MLIIFFFCSMGFSQADLSITAFLESNDRNANAGDRISLEYTIRNNGNVEVDDPVVGFYLSNDQTFDSNDILLETEDVSDLDPYESDDEGEQVPLPSNVNSDYYYILVVADPFNSVYESDENNNTASAAITIGNPAEDDGDDDNDDGGDSDDDSDNEDSDDGDDSDNDDDDGDDSDNDGDDYDGADLIFASAFIEENDLQSTPGSRITIEYALGNNGNEDAEEFNVGFFISNNTTLSEDDQFLENDNIGNVEVDEIEDENDQITLPNSLSSGTYYIILKADVDNSVEETNENNNTIALAIEIASTQEDPNEEAKNQIGQASNILKKQNTGEFASYFFEASYSNPVVVIPSISYNGSQPAFARIKNIQPNGFDYKIEEWDYLDGKHVEETLPLLVVEEGVHTLADGRTVEAGFIDIGTSSTTIPFNASFEQTPIVLTSVVSNNDSRAAVTRMDKISNTQFSVRLQAQENIKEQHEIERVAYIAITSGFGNDDNKNFEAIRTARQFTENWYSINFFLPMENPVFLTSMQTTNGIDTAVLRFKNLTSTSVQLKVQEEKSKDEEVKHATEVGGYVLFEAGNIFAEEELDDSTQNDIASTLSARNDPKVVSVQNYPNPFTSQTKISYNLLETSLVNLSVLDWNGRSIKTLVNGKQEAGEYEISFQSFGLTPGIYLCALQVDGEKLYHKMVIE
ncbi:T9SS type A sorting domain-containing protein [Galbibacter sp. BG1]|uniref:CARDB domain-containing protein n=1 Tax=Galbibacter sp. BG1 TaxID=1170699 RepID=UPI0015BAFC8E|nr:CARDB domain-containing protein [Galbibacter sp. BG1]QLE00117.1 T9SS type A sorting domain-containing protein [Galbibacter sp. BG1]